MPNPWDVGTAPNLASLGYCALATTSAGMAFVLDQREGQVSKKSHWRIAVFWLPQPPCQFWPILKMALATVWNAVRKPS